MTRETAPYLAFPIQRPKSAKPLYVLGPKLGPSYSELQAEVERLEQRLEEEVQLRLACQDRLSKCARAFAGISHLYPPLRGVIGRVRGDIWPEVGE